MKKLLLLTKTLLAAALLCVGQNAWGDPTTAFSADFTAKGESTDPADYGFTITTYNDATATVTDGVLKYSLPANSNKDVSAWGAASFSAIPTGNVVTVSCSWNPGGPTGTRPYSTLRIYGSNGTEDKVVLSLYNQGQEKVLKRGNYDGTGTQIASGEDWRSGAIVWNVVAVLNLNTQKVVSLTVTKAGESTPVVSESSINFENEVININKFEFGTNKKSNGTVTSTLDNVSVTYEAAASTVDVTFKYEDTAGNDLSSIKADVVDKAEVGATVSEIISSSLKNTFYNGDESMKYVYSTFTCTDETVPAGGTTVTLKFAPKAKYTYTVRALDGSSNVLNANIASGYVYAGDNATVAYPQYVLSGTTLYRIANNGTGDYYRKTITPNADGYVYDLTYNNGTVSNAVYYTEAEGITGFTAYSNNTNRASNGDIAYSSGAYKDLTSLTPGKYQVYTRSIRSNNNTHKLYVKCGEDVVGDFDVENGTNVLKNTDEFTVYTTSTLSVASAGGSQAGLDWIYVVKTGDVVKLNANGYATYSANYDVEVSGAKAYTAVLDFAKSKITCSEITSNKVPAGNGVLLYGGANADVTLSITTGAAALATNNLKATTKADGSLATKGSNNYYALSGDTFMKYTGDAFVHNKAYFEVTAGGDVKARSMSIVFDGNITGVANVEAAAEAKAKEGKFIENGKLVIVKNGQKFNAAGAKLY